MLKQFFLNTCAMCLAMASTVAWGTTLSFCSEGNPEYFTPSISSTATSFDAGEQIYDKLVDFEPGTTQLVPALAERWTVSEDGLRYTFHLRHNVRWQSNAWFTPTRDFNADDVLFTFERQWKPDHPFYGVTSAKHPYFDDLTMGQVLAAIEKLDDYTVRFVLKHPLAPFVANLAMRWAGIGSAEYAQAMRQAGTPERFDQMPLGTGPFQWTGFIRNVAIDYKAFNAHWAGRPHVDQLTFLITPDAKQRWAHLQSGACHIMTYPSPDDLPAMRDDKRFHVLSQTGLNVGFLAYNTLKKPFDDSRVRRALNMAIDKRKILRSVYRHTAVPAINPIPPIQWGYNRDVKDDEFDPVAAAKLLAEAGYPKGFVSELWAMPVQRSYMPDAIGVAELIQADLAAIGVRIKLKSPDWAVYVSRMQAGEHQMGLMGWTGDNGDPDNFLNTLLGCSAVKGYNVAKFCDSSYDDLVTQASKVSDKEERTRLYQRAQVIFKEQAPWFTIAHTVQFKVTRQEVEGFALSPLGHHNFSKVSLKP